MMKKILVILTFLLTIANTPYARADFEGVERVLGKLEDLQKEAQNVEEKLGEIQSEINAVRQGDFGGLKKISSKIANETKVKLNMSKETAVAVEGDSGIKDAVKNDTSVTYTDKKQEEAYFKGKDKVEAIRRENLARLYAYALTLRATLEKNRKEGASADKSITAKDSREILQSATTKEAMENARHLAHLWDMRASLFEIYLIDQSRQYSDKTSTSSDEGEE